MTKHIRMPKEIADKWLAALRSGKYEQGNGVLKTQDGKFCCLGVLEHCTSGEVENDKLPSTDWLFNNSINFLPQNSTSTFMQSPYIKEYSDYLHNLNDEGMAFSEIANLIESELEYTDGEDK